MFFAAGMLTGCHERAHHADDDPPTTMPGPTVEHSTKEIRSHVQDAPVQSGPPPLAYIVESAANVRVVDVTTNETLATAPCRAQAIVSVDPAGGVRIGDS